MKRIITIAIAGIMMLSGQAFGQGFTLKGKVSGVEEGKVTLQVRGGSKYATGIENGEFTLKGKVKEASLHTLRIDGVRGSAMIFVENAKMTLTADKTNLRGAKVTGSESQVVYAKYNELITRFSEERKPLNIAYSEARKAENEAEMEKLVEQFGELGLKQNVVVEGFIRENDKSIASAYILSSRARTYKDTAKLENAINILDKSLDKNDFVIGLNKTLDIAKKTAIGQPAMDFTQNDVNGKPVSLSDYRGQVVLVDFWAAWCGPCRGENPNVVEAYNKYNKKGFTVLGVSLDKDKARWLEAIEKDGLTWTQVSDLKYWDNEVAAMYGIRSIPANILVGKDGKILAKNLRGKALHEELAKIMR